VKVNPIDLRCDLFTGKPQVHNKNAALTLTLTVCICISNSLNFFTWGQKWPE